MSHLVYWLKITFGAALTVFAPIKPMLYANLFLVVIDTITGILAARAKGEPITSAKLRRAVGKAFVYTLVLMVTFVAGKYMLDSDMPAKAATALLGGVELLSVLENMVYLPGGGALKSLITKLGSKNDVSPPKKDVD